MRARSMGTRSVTPRAVPRMTPLGATHGADERSRDQGGPHRGCAARRLGARFARGEPARPIPPRPMDTTARGLAHVERSQAGVAMSSLFALAPGGLFALPATFCGI